MLNIVYLITLLTVGFSTLDIDGFIDISERLPKNGINIAPITDMIYGLQQEGREQQVEACAEICLESGYFCNSFVVLKTTFGVECRIFPTLGSIFKPSQDNRNTVIAAYEWESLPTAHELARRFSNSPSEQQVKYMSEKYDLPANWEEVTEKILKTCSTALKKNLPVTVTFTDWLRTGDLASSQLRRQSEFREQLSRALESWQAWLRDPLTPLQSPDLLILTFLDIFFKSLDEGITTIYDPNDKTLVVEGSEEHLLIHSISPGDYVLIFAQNKGGSPLIPQWSAYGSKRSEIDHETLEMFKGAMKNFNHEVSGERLRRLSQFISRNDNHTLSLKVVVDAINLMLAKFHISIVMAGAEMLFQDLVTAVVSSVIENEKTQPFRSNLVGATGKPGFKPVLGDIDIITG